MPPGYPNQGGYPGGPGYPGNPNQPGTTDSNFSTVSISPSDKLVLIKIDIDWSQTYERKVSPSIRSFIDQSRGEAMMVSGFATWQNLGSEIKKIEAAGVLPYAAFPRKATTERFNVPFPADQRTSWMCEILPFLGYESLSRRINRQSAWNNEANLQAGSAWIPEFLNPEFPVSSWRAHVPSLKGRELGATNFVGLTGVGMDSCEYADTPENAKKLGVFGYNRQTKIEDIVKGDGLANTIFVIQTSPNVPRPWLRGGGSTAQGVPTTESIKPFVYMTRDSRQGTFAVMSDGSVRFLSQSMSDQVFQALVTYKGGETIANLNQVAPLERSSSALSTVPRSGNPKR